MLDVWLLLLLPKRKYLIDNKEKIELMHQATTKRFVDAMGEAPQIH